MYPVLVLNRPRLRISWNCGNPRHRQEQRDDVQRQHDVAALEVVPRHGKRHEDRRRNEDRGGDRRVEERVREIPREVGQVPCVGVVLPVEPRGDPGGVLEELGQGLQGRVDEQQDRHDVDDCKAQENHVGHQMGPTDAPLLRGDDLGTGVCGGCSSHTAYFFSLRTTIHWAIIPRTRTRKNRTTEAAAANP